MHTFKIFVKDIIFDEQNINPGFLARYNLLLTNLTTNQQYSDVIVDIQKSSESGSFKLASSENFGGLINREEFKNIIVNSYLFHTEDGGFEDNFPFFDSPLPNGKQIHIEIDENGNPFEVHFMAMN